MHCAAAVEAAPSPEKKGECSHTASRPYAAVVMAPVSGSARSALDKSTAAVQTASSLATTDDF